MENSVIVILTVVLGAFVLYSLWSTGKGKREGLVSYDENTCLSLAQKNEANIADLDKQVKKLVEMQNLVDSTKIQNDSNTKSIEQIVQGNSSKYLKHREGLTSNDPYELSQMQQGKLEILQNKLNGFTMNQAEINELQRKVNKNADNVVQTQKEMARKDPNKKPYAYPDE